MFAQFIGDATFCGRFFVVLNIMKSIRKEIET